MSIKDNVYSASPIWAQNALISLQGALLNRVRRGSPTMVAEHARFETLSQPEVEAMVLHRLRETVSHARSHSAYYREAMPDDVPLRSLDDLRRLPILEKDALRHRTQDIRCSGLPPKLIESHTSGTTGTPITVFYRPDDIQYRMAAWERMWNWYGVTRHSRKVRFSGRTLFPKAEENEIFWRMNHASRQMFMSSYHMTAQHLDRYLDRIQSFGPELIDGYPSSIYLLARHALLRRKWTIRPKLVMTTAETLEDFQREAIAEAFQCPVKTQYGSSEGAPLACEDENGEIAVLPQTGIIEIVKPGTAEPVARGETGEMLVTSFHTHAYPLIRYRIGDTGALDGFTRKRPGFPRLRNLAGRQEDYVMSPERGPVGRLDPVFKKSPSSIRECQIVQSAEDTLELHYVPDPATFRPEHLAVVDDEIRLRCGAMTVRHVEHTTALPRSANGKLRAVIGLKTGSREAARR